MQKQWRTFYAQQFCLRKRLGFLREMTEKAVHASSVANQIPKKANSFGARHRRGFMIAAIVGFLLAVVGALDTAQIGFGARLVYWEILMISGAIIGLGVSEMVENWGRLRTRLWAEMPLVAILIGLPLTFMVIGTSALFFNAPPPDLSAIATMFALTFTISLVMTALNHFTHRPGTEIDKAYTAPISPALPNTMGQQLSARIPITHRHLQIIALESEDHYLRIYFEDAQSVLILMRLSDAIAELPKDKGSQTHRSWWVARHAIKTVSKVEGRATLTLNGNIEVPVSRNYYKVLNEADWFV